MNLPARITQAGLKNLFIKNIYMFASVLLLCFYVWATAAALYFIVENIRRAFDVNQAMVQSQIVTFDRASYEQAAKRFGLPPLQEDSSPLP